MMRTCQRRVDFYYLRDSLPACQGEHLDLTREYYLFCVFCIYQGGMLPSAADYLQAQGIVRHCGYHAVPASMFSVNFKLHCCPYSCHISLRALGRSWSRHNNAFTGSDARGAADHKLLAISNNLTSKALSEYPARKLAGNSWPGLIPAGTVT